MWPIYNWLKRKCCGQNMGGGWRHTHTQIESSSSLRKITAFLKERDK